MQRWQRLTAAVAALSLASPGPARADGPAGGPFVTIQTRGLDPGTKAVRAEYALPAGQEVQHHGGRRDTFYHCPFDDRDVLFDPAAGTVSVKTSALPNLPAAEPMWVRVRDGSGGRSAPDWVDLRAKPPYVVSFAPPGPALPGEADLKGMTDHPKLAPLADLVADPDRAGDKLYRLAGHAAVPFRVANGRVVPLPPGGKLAPVALAVEVRTAPGGGRLPLARASAAVNGRPVGAETADGPSLAAVLDGCRAAGADPAKVLDGTARLTVRGTLGGGRAPFFATPAAVVPVADLRPVKATSVAVTLFAPPKTLVVSLVRPAGLSGWSMPPAARVNAGPGGAWVAAGEGGDRVEVTPGAADWQAVPTRARVDLGPAFDPVEVPLPPADWGAPHEAKPAVKGWAVDWPGGVPAGTVFRATPAGSAAPVVLAHDPARGRVGLPAGLGWDAAAGAAVEAWAPGYRPRSFPATGRPALGRLPETPDDPGPYWVVVNDHRDAAAAGAAGERLARQLQADVVRKLVAGAAADPGVPVRTFARAGGGAGELVGFDGKLPFPAARHARPVGDPAAALRRLFDPAADADVGSRPRVVVVTPYDGRAADLAPWLRALPEQLPGRATVRTVVVGVPAHVTDDELGTKYAAPVRASLAADPAAEADRVVREVLGVAKTP